MRIIRIISHRHYNNLLFDAHSQNYCKEGPSVEGSRVLYNFWWHQWCKNSSGHDICCRGHKCSCNVVNANCACLTPEGYEYWERKKEVDWKNVKRIWETVKKFNVFYLMYKNRGKKTDDDSNEESKEASKEEWLTCQCSNLIWCNNFK